MALDPRLTETKREPAEPGWNCRDARGQPSVCQGALPDYITALRAWGREGWGRVAEIKGLQPRPPPTPSDKEP